MKKIFISGGGNEMQTSDFDNTFFDYLRKNANEWIKWYLEHRIERESKILDSLSSAVKTPREIAEIVYTEEDYRMYGPGLMARAQRIVIAHIEKLEKEGLVSPVKEEGIEKYCRT